MTAPHTEAPSEVRHAVLRFRVDVGLVFTPGDDQGYDIDVRIDEVKAIDTLADRAPILLATVATYVQQLLLEAK